MRSGAPASSGAIVSSRSRSMSGSSIAGGASAGTRRWVGSCAPRRPWARNGPSRLNPSGSAPSTGASGSQARTRSAKAVQLVERRRHRGRQERGHAAAEQPASHAVERGSIAHRIVTAPAVNVDIDEAGRDVRRFRRGVVVDLDRGDPPVLHDDPAGRDAVLEDQSTDDEPVRGGHRSSAVGRVRFRRPRRRTGHRDRSDRPDSATRSLRRGAVDVGDHPPFDEQRVAASGRRAAGRPRPSPRPPRSCRSRAGARCPAPRERLVERAGREIGRHHRLAPSRR